MGPQTIVDIARFRWCGLLLWLACALWIPDISASGSPSRPLDVVFVSPSAEGPYARTVKAFEQEIEALCAGKASHCKNGYLISRERPDTLDLSRVDPDHSVLVALGLDAARWLAAAKWTGKTIYALLPSQSYLELSACCIDPKTAHSALYLDQPMGRYFALARQLFPDSKRVGVLFGPDTAGLEAEVRNKAKGLGLSLASGSVDSSDDVGPALGTLLDSTEVLLAMADPVIFNNRTIYGVLLSTYRNRVPVIAYSESFVKAGAVAAVFTSAESVGTELAHMIHPVTRNRKARLPPPRFPRHVDVVVNRQVARSLGLTLPDIDAIRRNLEALP